MTKEKLNNKKKSPDLDKDGNSPPNAFWDFWAPILLTVTFYIGIRHYVAEARFIPSGSMLPGLQINDRIFIEKLSFRRRSPRRGEIVVFNSPSSFDKKLLAMRTKPLPSLIECGFVTFPMISFLPGIVDSACEAYIKRVVAIGGDQVLVNSRGEVFINGSLKSESYVKNFCDLTSNGMTNCKGVQVRVPRAHVFVLGDNRSNSWDGRYWPGGPFLPENQILGRAVFRFWPINRIGTLNSKDHNQLLSQ